MTMIEIFGVVLLAAMVADTTDTCMSSGSPDPAWPADGPVLADMGAALQHLVVAAALVARRLRTWLR
ncbi:hypothetical protein [Streptomyces hoynatensis]|uniref:Uncharacterized protein n=1 Tax=Streptomyces hoynatensis TaxID=1141874 RepID=A0A3A9Z061_9ACTN|nr:hypothetical protein [Streptomyces hoynatensis]RKN41595.1 hypothetical protein D7294_13925 [Streptomyces hoynatensis]